MIIKKFSVLSLTACSAMLFSLTIIPANGGEFDDPIRTDLVGEVITEPVVVQGLGTTEVSGNIFVNNETIATQGVDKNSRMVEIRFPQQGGRVIMRNNRLFNNGRIIHKGRFGTAAMATIKKTPGRSGRAEVSNNSSCNRGIISGHQ